MSEAADIPAPALGGASAAGAPNRPRVAHITTAHSADDSRILYREAAGLKELGFDVSVTGQYPRAATVEGVPIRPIPPTGRRFLRALLATWRGLRAAVDSRADLLHFHDPELLPAALLAKMFLRRRVVFDAHEDVSLFMLRDFIHPWLKRLVAGAIAGVDAFCVPRLDGVVVPTRRLNERYRPLARRVETFVNYPAPAFLRQRDAAWRPFRRRRNEVIHVGTLRVSRLEFLLAVARRFLQANPDWTWTFVGMHPPTLKWFQDNAPADLRPRVAAVGLIPHMEVAERLCRARIGVNYHTLETRQIQVAIPLKVFEYLACGLPVVTTRVPLLVELVADCPAVALSDEDVDAYAAALGSLASLGSPGSLASLAGTDKLRKLCSVARRFSDKRFNCRAEVLRLSRMYMDILQSTSRDGRKTRH